MDDNQFKAVEATTVSICVAASVILLVYFVTSVWWGGLIDAWHAEEMAKHETCYQEWFYSEAHQETWLRVDYCGKLDQ
jgi:hypothetical protein